MALDPSIYSNIQTPQAPNVLGSAEQVMRLSQLGMQQAAQQRQMQQTMAMRQAFAENTDAQGNVDQQGVSASLSRLGMGYMVPEQQQAFAKLNQAKADATTSQMQATHQAATVTSAYYGYLLNLYAKDPEAAKAAYPGIKQTLIDEGVPNAEKLPDEMDPGLIAQGYQVASHYKEQLANMATQAGIGETKAKTEEALATAAKARSETWARPQTPDGTPVTDPAQLVPYQVPKDHQANALDEIKNAQNIKSLAPKIMSAFQMGTSRNPVVAAQGQREFEGLMNTTVKDTEGTARQAAFDSIHRTMTPSGITATPGENATKARTVQEYLTSKMAAPTAKAYGIDLTKFDSTSPYQIPSQNNSQSGSSGSTTSATQSASPPPPANSIRMSRGGKTKWIPAGMKGAAISDGWDVVK